MDQLDRPEDAAWQARRQWFEDRQAVFAASGTDAPSEQACALMIDLQAIFCAGAWAASVILAAAIVESQARESGRWDKTKDRGPKAKEMAWLHRLRNRLLHEDKTRPVLTVEDQWFRRDLWEAHAKRAVDLAFAALYRESRDHPEP